MIRAAWDWGYEGEANIVFFDPQGRVINSDMNPHLDPDDMCRECNGEGWTTDAYDQEIPCPRCGGKGYVEVEE